MLLFVRYNRTTDAGALAVLNVSTKFHRSTAERRLRMTAHPEWESSITHVAPGSIVVRDHPLEDMVTSMSFTEAAMVVLTGRPPSADELRVLDAVMVCCVDHGLINTAAVASRYIMSGSASLTSAIAGGISTFGAKTGTSNLTAAWLKDIGGDNPSLVDDETLLASIKRHRDQGLPIPGFGHPVHKDLDPRELALRRVAAESGLADGYVPLLDRAHVLTNQLLNRKLVLNVDGLIGALLLNIGLDTQQILVVNLLGAMPGLAAHAIEESQTGPALRVPRLDSMAPVGTGGEVSK